MSRPKLKLTIKKEILCKLHQPQLRSIEGGSLGCGLSLACRSLGCSADCPTHSCYVRYVEGKYVNPEKFGGPYRYEVNKVCIYFELDLFPYR